MKAAQTIRQLGFRKWYERELIHSHAHLVLLVLCAVGLLGSAEVYSSSASLGDQLLTLLCAMASTVIGLWALRRYVYLLMHAEHVANQAVCPKCDTYAKWRPLDEDARYQRLSVQCKRCEWRWDIEL